MQHKSNKILTTQMPAYFPALHYFWKIQQCDVLVLTDHFQYTKRSPLTISAQLQSSQPALRLPVRHLVPKSTISEKKFDQNSNWAKKNLHTIKHMFNCTPYYYYYMPILEEMLIKHDDNLAPFLANSISSICNLLHFDIKVEQSSLLSHQGKNELLISEWSQQFSCNAYINEAKLFKESIVNSSELEKEHLNIKTFIPFPDYHILQSNKDLSILHFLFHYGPEAGYLLRQYLPSK